MPTPQMYGKQLAKIDDLLADNERLENAVRTLADLLRQSVYFVPAGLFRDRIESALDSANQSP